ncbi:MAG: ATP-dependent RecD-like DNA helicase [Chitinivibrionales bacterium]|nr:ATP-dependent RecD-like DNA helicase [Chitinivibrionales bacterium]
MGSIVYAFDFALTRVDTIFKLPMPTLTGSLERITFHNEENGFTVARMLDSNNVPVTIVGTIAALNPGEFIQCEGDWVKDPKFGEQFKVSSYRLTVPVTVAAITKYLSSGLIKGIGDVMAQRIVARFGADALAVIDTKPERLKEVEGIGRKRIGMVKDAWKEQRAIKDLMIFLQGLGISSSFAAKIYKRYGGEAMAAVQSDPYRLADDIDGIGFLSADKIAARLGIAPSSEKRARAAVLHTLSECVNDGHVYFPWEALVERTATLLTIETAVIVFVLDELAAEGRVISDTVDGLRVAYPAPLFQAESQCAKSLARIACTPGIMPHVDEIKACLWAEAQLRISLADAQQKAVQGSLKNKLLVITGGPGTGKTTIIRAILAIYKRIGFTTLLAAPTGRAAKRMQETTGHPAQTIHRLLEYNFKKGGFVRNRNNPLEANAVIIDESSMLDTSLASFLLRAIPPPAHLILVGDINQLPSVGPGTVLKDIIQAATPSVITLTEIFRQAHASAIVLNAHRINQGEFPVLAADGAPSDFFFVNEEQPEAIVEKIVKLCRERIPQKYGLNPLKEVQVLTPMHRGVIGVKNLNEVLQKNLNNCESGLAFGGVEFKFGDKVMQIANNYDKDIFNGDIGYVASVNQEERALTVDFDGRIVAYQNTELYELMLAYAISVHKSQGSEYPAVVIPIATQHYLLLQRNLIYTAITRAKKLVVMVGTTKALGIAIRNNEVEHRYTNLRQRIIDCMRG